MSRDSSGHLVIRSGVHGLGSWQRQRRNLYEDCQHYMGESPARRVKVWLIAHSIFNAWMLALITVV
ncbi:MAG TPA: DUF3047 domain-containing protein [Rhodospirillales bacterium]|nr:DUF3047 domain-containing protein [Rhodospirillales bacterium]